MIKTAGRAKVVKKAVAPAILRGSFFLNSSNDLRSRAKIFILLRAAVIYRF
jgi:hypothetical protein